MSREEFWRRYRTFSNEKGRNSRVHSDEKYSAVLQALKDRASNLPIDKANKVKYGWVKRFKLETCDGEERMLDQKSGTEVVQMSRMFDVIHDVHMQMGHAGRNKMEAECKERYYNVQRAAIAIYLETCKTCELKKARPRDKTVTRPILTDDISRRGQVDLIDWASTRRSSGFRYILNYQDHLTKFVVLRPLKRKRAEEVAHHLLDIFCLFGAPNIIQVYLCFV